MCNKIYITIILSLGYLLNACAPLTPSEVNNFDNSTEIAGIIGGDIVADESDLKKHVVQIRGYQSGYSCTGVLIHPRIVLTAGHCVVDDVDDMKIFFGRNPSASNLSPDSFRSVQKIVVHKDYIDKGFSSGADLALIELDIEAPEEFTPASLPGYEFITGQQIGLTSFGYGRSNTDPLVLHQPEIGSGILRQVELFSADFSRGNPLFSVDQSHHKGICKGDSGGPSFYKYGKNYVVLGIHSTVQDFNSKVLICSYKGNMVNTYFHLSWIKTSMTKLLNK